MPDAGEPLPGAPTNYWAGQYDAEQFANALGMTWTTGIFATTIPRMVNIPTLCAAPKPAAPEFTTADILTGIVPGSPGRAAADAKIVAFTDAYLWETYCSPIGDPPPAVEPQPPPADLPSNPIPILPDHKYLRDIHQWVEWMRRQVISRKFLLNTAFEVSGTGTHAVEGFTGGDWPVKAAGAIIVVTAKPDWVGRTNGGDPAMYWDLGWCSFAGPLGSQQPFRLQRDHQVVYGSTAEITEFWYTLLPGVTIYVTPMYPETTTTTEG